MPTEREQRIANAKQIVLDVLAGRLTPENNPAAFEEDTVYIAVRITEQHDPDWLLQRLTETNRSSAGIQQVIDCIGPLRERAQALVQRA